MKIVTVIGARPQFIKAATVSRAIATYNASIIDHQPLITEVIIHTGQHFDANMSDIFFEEMQIPKPDYFLEINSLSHGAMTGRMLEKIEEILLKEKPDYVLVYGDTNSTLAGALAAKKLHIKVVHVEAGLRSFNVRMPEEINRILADRISDILCCPTETAVKNLQNEGFTTDHRSPTNGSQLPTTDHRPIILNTGDVMLDAALFYSTFSSEKSAIINDLELAGKDFALCTIHRAENTDDPERLSNIFKALTEFCNEMPVVLPLHPRTLKILKSSINSHFTGHQSLIVIDPVGYFDMIELLKQTRIVLTDSGGLQKEAFFFKKPCVTLRDETEWLELVEGGVNCIAGAKCEDILSACHRMFGCCPDFSGGYYGDGNCAQKIISYLQVCVSPK